ncbi:MAG: hypothetical protein HY904_25165 [Deltaproteobacteria bacterium]|nr:hypothetical protein [Deltaproteobacteria bacterium]
MPIVDIPTGVDGFTLPQAFEVLADLYRRVDEHAARLAPALDLLCHAGCSACCRDSVFLTTLEALFLLNHLEVAFSPEARARVVRAGVATFQRHGDRILAFGHPECPGAPALTGEDARERPAVADRVAAALSLRFDCPVLDDAGRCTAYAARELRGRLFGVSRLQSRDEFYACKDMGRHLEGREVRLMDAEAVAGLLRLSPLTRGEQVIPYYVWRYAALLA